MSKLGWIIGGLALLAGGSALAASKKRRDQDAARRAADTVNQSIARGLDRAEFGPFPKQSLVDREVSISAQGAGGEAVTLHVTAENRETGELHGFVVNVDGTKHHRGDELKVNRSAVTEVFRS